MTMTSISTTSFKFLKELTANNNRDWFQANKDRYQVAQTEAKAFLEEVEKALNKFDQIEKKKLFRIYRDVRFSKDKTPYNTALRMSLGRDGHYRRGGYYIQIGPGVTKVGGGFYNPNPADLKRIRDNIALDATPLRKILKSKAFKSNFGELLGEQLKTSPKGYDKEHPDIDLLRYKSMYVFRSFTDKEAKGQDMVKDIAKTYKAIRPFFDYMTEILTHDLDGVPLYG
jgi:uncharacterized protein (TIGR02453 family)